MKWAPFRADSLNNIPLFPIIPTGCPKILAKPVTRVCMDTAGIRIINCTNYKNKNLKSKLKGSSGSNALTVPYNFLNSSNSLPSTM